MDYGGGDAELNLVFTSEAVDFFAYGGMVLCYGVSLELGVVSFICRFGKYLLSFGGLSSLKIIML